MAKVEVLHIITVLFPAFGQAGNLSSSGLNVLALEDKESSRLAKLCRRSIGAISLDIVVTVARSSEVACGSLKLEDDS
jgi:hypothetical protein